MRVLGAILAGGKSTRFGADKAAALVDGRALLDHVAGALAAQTDALLLCGRAWPGLTDIADRPAPDLGPLGGLCAALRHAADAGYGHVLTAGCDVLPVPPSLRETLSGQGAAIVAGQPLFGWWPAGLADLLDAHLAKGSDRSIRGWVAACGARVVAIDTPLANLNTPADLADYLRLRTAPRRSAGPPPAHPPGPPPSRD